MLWDQKQTISEKDGLLTSMNDTLKVWKDKDGLNHGSIGVITTTDPKDFINLPTNDPEIKRLQAEVEKYRKQIKNRGSVTTVTSNTSADIKVPTVVVQQPQDPNFPIYRSKFDLDGWIYGTVEARKDSTLISPRIRNEYTVVIGQEKQGFLGLGKPKPFVEVVNKNPYTETTQLRTYQVDDTRRKSHWNFGLYGGYGATLVKKEVVVGPQVGGGITYNFKR